MTVVVEALGGLCNRLRVVLSYRANYGAVDVVWRPTGEVGGACFRDVFEPLEGLRFFDEYADPVLKTTDPLHVPWMAAYQDLRLLPEHQARFMSMREQLGLIYQAMHVRRTDLPEAMQHSPDGAFLAWCAGRPGPFFLATDNGTTQRTLRSPIEAMGKKLHVLAPIREHERQDESNQRNTTLADAALDLFLCAGASDFKGTFNSSFSNAVIAIRRMQGWWR